MAPIFSRPPWAERARRTICPAARQELEGSEPTAAASNREASKQVSFSKDNGQGRRRRVDSQGPPHDAGAVSSVVVPCFSGTRTKMVESRAKSHGRISSSYA